MKLAPTPHVTEDGPLVLHICAGTEKAFRVRTADGEVLGHFDSTEDAGHACRSAVAAAARLVGRGAV